MGFINKFASVFLRIALAVAFLSAVADRFGLWGNPGDPGVAWGDFAAFTNYTAFLNPWAPEGFVPFLAWTATVVEAVFAIGLLVGFKTRWFASLSGVLLLVFGLAMTFTSSIKAPLDYSVFSASAAAFALATFKTYQWSLDRLLEGDSTTPDSVSPVQQARA